MRITENMKTAQVLRDLAKVRSEHARASEVASTGQRINSPSDDPSAAARMQRVSSSLADNASLSDSLSLAKTDLEQAESTLAEAGSIMQRVKELALTAANGTLSADDRLIVADELHGIFDAMLGLANAEGVRGALFAGSQTDQAAFDASGVFLGDDYEHSIRSGAGTQVVINSSGARAFTAAGGRDVFADLADLEAALRADDQAGIRTTLEALDEGHDQIVSERARAGVNLIRVDQSLEVLSSAKYLDEIQLNRLGGADPAESLSELSTLQGALQRSIAISSQMLQLDAFSIL